MSHEHLRKERDCLNCGATVAGDYCQNCGQRNVLPRQTFWHLITHFFNDITHFDGKFFSTMKLLLFRPGFLSAEWVKGRRTKYLDPIRMYLFISAMFFIIIAPIIDIPQPVYFDSTSKEAKLLDSLRTVAATENQFEFSWHYLPEDSLEASGVFVLNFEDDWMHGIAHYDSIQKTLPARKRDNFIERYIARRSIVGYEVYDHEPYVFFSRLVNNYVHSLSKIFLISLPIFAFLLWLFYVRSRKQYYFVSHAIFSIHYYSISFIFLALTIGIMAATEYIPNVTVMEWVDNIVSTLALIAFPVYLYIAMKRFYGQGWFKTLVKTTFIFTIQCILLAVLSIGLGFNSFFSMGSH